MRRIIARILVIVMAIGLISSNAINAKAVETAEQVDGSYLLEDDSSVGTAVPLTRGIYLKSGTSVIRKTGYNSIAAGGDTIAQKTVSKIAITVEVQWLVSGSWKTLTTWSVTKTNTTDVSTSKTLTVPNGHFYRVYCRHYANSDSSGSFTNGIYI